MQKPEELNPQAPLQDGESVKVTTRPNMGPIFALTIGINKYQNEGALIRNLSGCVADADDVKKFLSEDLHCTDITSLRNEKATAANITKAFESFANRDDIPKDAIIFIFYAGHGTQASPPKNYDYNDLEKIQMLMPHDFYPGLQSTTTAASSETSALGDKRSAEAPTVDPTVIKNGLLDIQLGRLIEKIANSKGRNITVIFDCCHSGSATRGQDLLVVRGIDLLEGSKLDVGVLSANRGEGVLERDKNRGLACHVLLTACNQLESAYEKNGRGVFTTALLKFLRESQDLDQLTYSDIIESIPPINGQKPQCEGVNRDRIFLNNRVAVSRRIFYNLTQNGSEYILNAGEANGVIADAEFAIYDKKSCSNELGRLIVHTASSFRSLLKPADGVQSFDIPKQGAFALQIGITQDLHIFVEGEHITGIIEAVEKQISQMSASTSSFKVVAARDDKPDLIVTSKSGIAQIEIRDELCHDAGLYWFSHQLEPTEETMTNVLLGAARFYRNLRRTTSTKGLVSSKINFGCYELSEMGRDDDLLPIMMPTDGTNLYVAHQVMDKNLHVDGTIDLVIDDLSRTYGFCITNTSGVALFASVFYFSMSDLSVDFYYQPPAARDQDHFPSIEAKKSLTIGYGSGGSPPYTFFLNEGQDVDVGYIKIFLTTKYVDYGSVSQRSPFKVDDGRHTAPSRPNSNLWDTMVIRVIQRRAWTSTTKEA